MRRLPYSECKAVYDQLGIVFNVAQVPAIEAQERFPVIIGGERGGKTFTTAAIILPHVVLLPIEKSKEFLDDDGRPLVNFQDETPRDPHFLLFGPTYAEGRKEFEQLETWLRKLGLLYIPLLSKPKEGQWSMVTKYGVVVQTWSTDTPGNIRAFDIEGGAACESGNMFYVAIERIQGRISNKRSFMVYSGTLEDAQRWYQDWAVMGERPNHLGIVTYSLPTWTNLIEFPGGKKDPEILRLKAIYSDDLFAMRVAAEARPPRNRVLREARPNHVGEIQIPDTGVEYEIWIDPGYASAYAVLFVAFWDEFELFRDRRTGKSARRLKFKRFYVFDELYEQGLLTQDMIDLFAKHPYSVRISRGVMDVAGKGRRDAGESALEIWTKKSGVAFAMAYWFENVLIERVRSSFKQGQMTISPKCKGLLAEAGLGEPVFDEMHPWKYKVDRDQRITSEKPIDRWNHSAKALGYGLLNHLGVVEALSRPKSYNRINKKKSPRRLR